MTLQWSQIGLTLGLTFIVLFLVRCLRASARGWCRPPGRYFSTGSAVAVHDPTPGEVVRADFDQDLVTSEQLDPELGELPCSSAQALVTSRLLEGDQIEPVALFLFDHARGFDHGVWRPAIQRAAL